MTIVEQAPACLLSALRLHLPAGLVGLPRARDFELEPVGPLGALGVLRCTSPSALPSAELVGDLPLQLIVVAPVAICPSYSLDLPDAVAEQLGVRHPDDAGIVALVTARRPPGNPTANLYAPVVFHRGTGLGLQLVPSRSPREVGYSTETPFPACL